MTKLNTVELTEWRITFVMAAGKSRRTFEMTIPATDRDSAVYGAHQIAMGINDATGHVWKLTDGFTATPSAGGAR